MQAHAPGNWRRTFHVASASSSGAYNPRAAGTGGPAALTSVMVSERLARERALQGAREDVSRDMRLARLREMVVQDNALDRRPGGHAATSGSKEAWGL